VAGNKIEPLALINRSMEVDSCRIDDLLKLDIIW